MLRLKLLGVCVLVVGADQLTKLAVVRTVEIGETREVIDGILMLTHVRNSGAAFGLLRGMPGLLTLAAIAGVIFFAYFIVRSPPPLTGTAAALVAGGALGNLADRLTRGTVVDFIHVPHWPSFNVADIAVTVGAGLLLLTSFRKPPGDTGA